MYQEFYSDRTGENYQVEVDTKKLTLKVRGQGPQAFETPQALVQAYIDYMTPLIELECFRDYDNVLITLRNPLDDEENVWVDAHPMHITTQELPDADIPVGASKRGGSPDMPPGLAYPEGGELAFAMQINLAELSNQCNAHNLATFLPESGMLYLFIDEECSRGLLLHAPAHEGLVRLDASLIPPFRQRYYARDLASARLGFEPAEEPGEDLEEEEDFGSEGMEGFTLFGEPALVQDMPPFSMIEREVDAQGFARFAGSYQQLIQLPIGEGYMHVGMPGADVERGIFERAVCVYVGT